MTRGAEADESGPSELEDLAPLTIPGSIVEQVASELKARRFAGEVRLQVSSRMPKKMREWLRGQLECLPEEVYPTEEFLGIADLLKLDVPGRERSSLPDPPPMTHLG